MQLLSVFADLKVAKEWLTFQSAELHWQLACSGVPFSAFFSPFLFLGLCPLPPEWSALVLGVGLKQRQLFRSCYHPSVFSRRTPELDRTYLNRHLFARLGSGTPLRFSNGFPLNLKKDARKGLKMAFSGLMSSFTASLSLCRRNHTKSKLGGVKFW